MAQIKNEFFSLSDITFKYRRNVLFFSSLCIIHYKIVSLEKFKIGGVEFASGILDWLLLFILLWFAFNYFYYLYADYTEWKSKAIIDVDVPDEMTDKSWKHFTLIPEICSLTNKGIGMKAEFSTSKGYVKEKKLSDEEIKNEVQELMGYLSNQIMSAIKTDIARIDSFQNRIKRYHWINRLRFYVLDLFVPIVMIFIVWIVADNELLLIVQSLCICK